MPPRWRRPGISGFESSANLIEEHKHGVLPKTLRDMWIAVPVFNPLISFLSLGMIPLDQILQAPPDLLARMGTVGVAPGGGYGSIAGAARPSSGSRDA